MGGRKNPSCRWVPAAEGKLVDEALDGIGVALLLHTDDAALEMHYRFVLWLVLAVERFPRSQKFLLGDRIQTMALDELEARLARGV